MSINIIGHSGCSIEILHREGRSIVRKRTSKTNYTPRLQKQASKQAEFLRTNLCGRISAPEIYNECIGSAGYYFDMQFCNACDFITYFTAASKQDIDRFIDVMDGYFRTVDERCRVQSVSRGVLQKKYTEVRSNVLSSACQSDHSKELVNKLDEFISTIPAKFVIPVGCCHGDLTLSNILFNRSGLVFIDFLDSYIETPLQDMVKIRQDTKFHWSFLLYASEFDKVKMEIVLDYIDYHMETIFAKYDYYVQYYKYFQVLNFARILPYSRSDATTGYLMKTINLLLEEKTL